MNTCKSLVAIWLFSTLILSCQPRAESEHNSAEAKKAKTESTKYEKTENEPKLADKVVTALSKQLYGLWVSENYKKELWKQNSISAVEYNGMNYTDLFFDGSATLYASTPLHVEEDYLKIQANSTILDRDGQLLFAIRLAKGDSLHLLDTNQQLLRFYRLKKEIDKSSISQEVWQGHQSILKEWIAGDYHLSDESSGYDIKIWPNGKISSDQDVQSVSPFSYEGQDMIEFEFSDHNELYLFKRFPDGSIELEGIEDITEDDAPIVKTEKNAYLERKLGA